MDSIAQASEGKPRTINMLCEMALVYGFADGASRISGKLIDIVLADKKEYGVLPP
jgi:type II secretory pathway predicted ATPase ExeA